MINTLLDRLDEGAGHPCLFLPFCGEFGHLIMTHTRMVHFHKASRKVVCCRPGEEVLFPSADEFVTDWRDPLDDKHRIATLRNLKLNWPEIIARYPDHARPTVGRLLPSEELFSIHPYLPIPFQPKRRDLQADVVLGVRHRTTFPERNWNHWQYVADALENAGYTFAVVGNLETSQRLIGEECQSGDYDTDAAIELMQKCKLFVGTDSGSSHLAATVQAPMLIFREQAHQSRNLVPRMQEVNRQLIQYLPEGWYEPDSVIDAILSRLRQPHESPAGAA